MSVTTVPPSVPPHPPSHPAAQPPHKQPPLPNKPEGNRVRPDTSMKLALRAIDHHGLVHAAAEGSITAHDFRAQGADPFEALLGANWKHNRVLLDFAGVTYIDSSAIGWLINAHRAFKGAGGRLVVYAVQPAVKQILDVLKVGKVVALAETEQAAREILDAGGAD